LVDEKQTTTPADFLAGQAPVLIFVFIFLMVVRPIVFTGVVMFLMNTLFPNIATLVRWRSHRYVIGQSIG